MNEDDEAPDSNVQVAELYVKIEWLKVQAEMAMPDNQWSWQQGQGYKGDPDKPEGWGDR